MEKRNLALSLLFLSVIVSGCADNSEGKVSGKAITVEGPNVEPTDIYEGSSVRASMGVKNTGEINGTVILGENGTRVLTNYCTDFFSIENYEVTSPADKVEENSYRLRPGQQLRISWEINQEGGNVPLKGYSCPMRFQIPFKYTVQAFKQIKVKQDDETETGDIPLSSKSSSGPLTLLIETLGSSARERAPVFLKDDSPEVLFQLVNEEPEQSIQKGIITVKDLEIESSGLEIQGREKCRNWEEGEIELVTGRSQVIRCDLLNIDEELGSEPSLRAEVSAKADYTYVKDLGSFNVEVEYRGN